jgi:hypothetical protein
MALGISAGVYPNEVNYSAYVKAKSTSTWGVVGLFEKGPIGVPVLVGSLDEAQRIFGNYLTTAAAGTGFAMLALKNFFENGGNKAVIVRTVKYTGATPSSAVATVTAVDQQGTPANCLTVKAAVALGGVSLDSPGVWANGVQVVLSAGTADATNQFNLVVKDAAGNVLETYSDLWIGYDKRSDPDHVERRVNGKSAYIAVSDLYASGQNASTLRRPAFNTVTLAAGNDGLTGIATTDFIGSSSVGNGLYALDTADVNFVSIPGEAGTTAANYTAATALGNALLDYCAGRKDCVAIIEAPQGNDAAGHQTFVATLTSRTASGTYGGLYGPWVTALHPTTSQVVTLPPWGFVAGVFARNDREGAVWTAPAGPNRGGLIGALGTEKPMPESQRDAMYTKGVNPIALVAGGLQVYGQKTLALKASALDRMNVRRLLCFIEASIEDAANGIVFEANNKDTWESFKRTVSPFLRRIKDGGGFYDFVVVCDESINTPDLIDTNTMKARILVKPTKTAEFIAIDFAIAPTGANFATL